MDVESVWMTTVDILCFDTFEMPCKNSLRSNEGNIRPQFASKACEMRIQEASCLPEHSSCLSYTETELRQESQRRQKLSTDTYSCILTAGNYEITSGRACIFPSHVTAIYFSIA